MVLNVFGGERTPTMKKHKDLREKLLLNLNNNF